MKPINTSTYDFPTLIQSGCVYVDKTAQIYGLVSSPVNSIGFLPRPRRFGKSLLLSTLKALFQGRRELFKGLAIEKTDWNWEREVYPVLHIDMSDASAATAAQLEKKLSVTMRLKCEEFGVPYDASLSASSNFLVLLTALPAIARQRHPNNVAGKFVVLIDEYDAPIAGLLDSEASRAELPAARKLLHDFYVVAKSHCGDMRFLMATGVSKFAKTSIFSAFNNPVDLALDACTADIVGYTHEEMETYFHEHIQAFADERGVSYDAMFAKLLAWYDGYQFSPKRLVQVVNPVSLGRALTTRELKGWWESTAGSTLLYSALKARNKAPFDFAAPISANRLDAADALTASTAALLYQGGYLTIDERIDDETVLLKVPNHEVRESIEDGYMSELLGCDFEIDRRRSPASRSMRRGVPTP